MEENATQNAVAVSQESAPVTTEVAVSQESAPVTTEVAAEQTTEVEGSEPSKAVKELIAQRKRRQQAEQEAAYWRGVAEARGTKTQEIQASTPVEKPVSAIPVPRPEDFPDSWEDYERAKDEYLIQQATVRFNQQNQQETQRRQAESEQQTFIRRIETAAKEDPLLIDLLADNTLPVSQAMAPIITSSDHAPELLKWLHSNRQEAARIAAMPPILAAKELGAIEAQIKFKPKPAAPKTVSIAPEPIQTVTTSTNTTVDEDNLPIDEWIKRRNKLTFRR